MNFELSPMEARVIGALIEKAITTPDNYPLSLNSLTLACNQKSNREPVLELSDADVLDVVDPLIERHLIREDASSRVKKYAHRFCNTEFGDLQLNPQQLGVVCCLLLRGPQTPGELRTRTNRLCAFSDVRETEAVLDGLVEQGWVQKLPREAGKRESRYIQLFSNAAMDGAGVDDVMPTAAPASGDARITALETEVAALRDAVTTLQARLDELC